MSAPRRDTETGGLELAEPERRAGSEPTNRVWRLICGIVIASLSAHLGILVLSATVLGDLRFENYPMHAVVEVGGAAIGVLVAAILILQLRQQRGPGHAVWITAALLAMSTLDGVHGVLAPGQSFVFLHSAATLGGGILFSLSWLPRQPSPRVRRLVWSGSLGLSVGLSCWALAAPESLPVMVRGREFTSVALFMNVAGGVLLIAAAVRFLMDFKARENDDDLLFSMHCLLFGAAAIMFEQSSLWDAAWWGWHLLRMAAYAVALWFAMRSDLHAMFSEAVGEDPVRIAHEELAAPFAGLPGWLVAIVAVLCVLPSLAGWVGSELTTGGVERGELIRIGADEAMTVTRIFAASLSSQLDLLLDGSAVAVAMFAALLALVHFRLQGDPVTLIIGASMLVAVLLDGAHTMISAGTLHTEALPARLMSLTWTLSRICNAALPMLAFLLIFFVRRAQVDVVLWSIAIVSFVALCGFSIVVSDLGTGPSAAGDRFDPSAVSVASWDLYLLAVYVMSGVLVYPLLHGLVHTGLAQALWLSVLPNMFAEIHMLIGDAQLDGFHYRSAHGLRTLAYMVPCAGLIFDYMATYRRANSSERIVREQFESAQRARLRFEQALEGLPVSILAVDPEGAIVLANAEAERTFGYLRDELRGQSIEILVPESVRTAHTGYRARYLGEDRRRSMGQGRDLRGVRRDGSEFPVEVALNPIATEEGRWVLAAAIDTSELHRHRRELIDRTRSLERSNADLEQFAYIASHDLQEPIRMVASYAQLLESRYAEHLDERALKYLSYVISGAKRMQQLVSSLLLYSRAESASCEALPTDASTAAQAALENLTVRIQESRAVVECSKLPVVQCDPVQLTQLFQNLIGNGIKFNHSDPPRIQISSQPVGDRFIVFKVADNGIGIAPQHQSKIFGIFSRLHSREAYAGTGLGLAITRKIVERNQGEIWLESVPDEGSTFYFTLPIADDAEREKPSSES